MLPLTKSERKKFVFEIPIEQAVYVPSTNKLQHQVTRSAFTRRVNSVRKFMGQKFGGFTSMQALGGYYSEKEHKVIREPVMKVIAFSTQQSYRRHGREMMMQLAKWDRRWGQESMGYELKGHLYYISGGLGKRKRR